MSKKPKQRVVTVPIHGPVEHNAAPATAIGQLIIAWANNESVFLAMFQVLMGNTQLGATIIWVSQRTSRSRLELLDKLARDALPNHPELIAEIQAAIKRFKGLSRLRNFYAHATYQYDENFYLTSAHGYSWAEEGDPVRPEDKLLNTATFNEIGQTIVELGHLNRHLWSLVPKMEAALQVKRVKYPRPIAASLSLETTHPPTEDSGE